MDLATVRNRLFTGFKPKELNIDTPYLEDLDGELKLVGLTGKQRIELEEQSTPEIINKDGTATAGKFNRQKFLALCLASCLRLRSTGEQVFTPADVLGESGNGDGLSGEMDSGAYFQLVTQVSDLVGNKPAKEIKNDSEPTNGGSDTSSLPQGSDEPLTNSSEALTAQN